MRKLSLLFLSFAAVFSTYAANQFVTMNGNDSSAGLSWGDAKVTIQEAIQAANAGDTVFVAAGVYYQTVQMKDGVHLFGGYDALTGQRDVDAYATILDGTGLKAQLLKFGACKQTTYADGLVLQNASHTSNGGAVAMGKNAVLNRCVVSSCYTDGSGGGVYNNAGLVSNCVVELCEALGASGAVHNSGGAIVENTIIRGCKGNYAAIRNEGNSIVRNCLIHNNEPSGSDWPNSGGIYNPSGVVYNNTLVCNYGSQYAGIHSDNIAYNNLLWNNLSEEGFADPANYISGESTKYGSGNNAGDVFFDAENFSLTLSRDNMGATGPHFVAPTNFVGAPKNAAEIAAMRAANFAITGASAVIDKGKAVADLTYDIEQTVRPIGGKVDIGCYEYDPNAPKVDVAGVVLNMDTVFVYTTDTMYVTAIILPKKANNRNVTWQVVDTSIAQVTAQGGVMGMQVGQTMLTVTTEEGQYTDSAVIVVELKPVVVIHEDVLLADSLYHIEDYTIPSYIPFLVAKETARKDSTADNLQTLRDKIALLLPYQMPYNVVTNINGDPKTRMAFCWFTNERMKDGVVELMPISNDKLPSAENFSATMTVPATATVTLPLNYATSSSGILKAANMKSTQEYTYVSHKAIAENLAPGTTYAYRVGVDGYWSEIAKFVTASDKSEPFTFIYMTDSHIMNQEYIDDARKCAEMAVNTTPEAQFCVFPGDFVETGTNRNSEWEWERWFEEALRPVIQHMPIVPTDGNHDDSENMNYSYHFNTDNQFKENAQVKPQFDGTTYSFMYGDVLFLVFSMQDYWRGAYSYSTMTSAYLTNDVGNWFKDQVAAHPEAKLRVALVHYNIFSGSGHQEDQMCPMLRATMLPVMKECQIDVVLQGHDHCYEVIGPVNPDTKTPIKEAITDLEKSYMSMSRYQGGTFTVNDGTLYFIGATCGSKRYNPNSQAVMEADLEKHKVENYYDLFTGMFCQPGSPSYSAFTVDGSTITVNSYRRQNGNAQLFNTFKIQRTKNHTTQTSKNEALKVMQNGSMYIVHDQITYNAQGQIVKDDRMLKN